MTRWLLIILVTAFLLASCSSPVRNYKDAEWYKNSERTYSLEQPEVQDIKASDFRTLSIQEKTHETGLRQLKNRCAIRLAPDLQSQVLRRTGPAERLWTQDLGGEWFRVPRKKGQAFVHKSCVLGSAIALNK